jgi:hypothetical protein
LSGSRVTAQFAQHDSAGKSRTILQRVDAEQAARAHYRTEAEAAAAVKEHQDGWDDDDQRELEVRREDFRCVQAVSLCGRLYVYEGDDFQSHFVDRQNVIDCMEVFQGDPVRWIIERNGQVLCDQVQCRTCRPWLNRDIDPLTVPVTAVDGQEPLPLGGGMMVAGGLDGTDRPVPHTAAPAKPGFRTARAFRPKLTRPSTWPRWVWYVLSGLASLIAGVLGGLLNVLVDHAPFMDVFIPGTVMGAVYITCVMTWYEYRRRRATSKEERQ